MANTAAVSAGSDIKKREGRTGRPKSSPLEQAQRRALQARRHLDLAESEFKVRLSDDLSDPQRSAKVNSAADLRLKAAEVLNIARMRLSQATAEMKNKAPNARAHVESAKAAERSAWAAFRSLPDLGFTQEEWDDPELRKRELGRPQLDVEIKLVRARLALDEAMSELRREEEAAGVKHVPLDKLHDPVKLSRGQGLGRPKLDRLGILDLKLSHLDKKIENIKADLNTKKDVVVQNRIGRKPEAPAVKLQKAENEADEIRKLIEAEEAKLDGKSLILRKLKKLRDERRRMTLFIKANPNDCEDAQERFDYLTKKINERMAELAVLVETPKQVQNPQIKPQDISKPVEMTQTIQPQEVIKPVESKRPIIPPDFDYLTIAVNPGTTSLTAAERAAFLRRKAEAMIKSAELEEKYAKAREQISLLGIDKETSAFLVKQLEQKLQNELEQIDIELIS